MPSPPLPPPPFLAISSSRDLVSRAGRERHGSFELERCTDHCVTPAAAVRTDSSAVPARLARTATGCYAGPKGSAMHDVAIIGGGHNGLVCAAYLAMGGLKVVVLEARPVVGGAAVT